MISESSPTCVSPTTFYHLKVDMKIMRRPLSTSVRRLRFVTVE
jgi:hypothetical protein